MRIARFALLTLLIISFILIPMIPARGQATPTSDRRDFVILDDIGVLRMIDATSGQELLTVGETGALTQVVVAGQGTVFASVSVDGASTEIIAAQPLAKSSEVIAEVSGVARVLTVSTDGRSLMLVTYGEEFPTNPLPSTTIEQPIPDAWQSGESLREEPLRDLGGGLFTPDQRRWYGLQAERQGNGFEVDLHTVTFNPQSSSADVVLSIPTSFFYFSLLASPDGATLYAIDHRTGETIHVIDPFEQTIVRSSTLRDIGSKASPCAAALSPKGDRLYIVGRDGATGDGIDVIDTSTLKRVDHYSPGQDFACVALSPDGTRLFTSVGRTLLTIDTTTGRQLQSTTVKTDLDQLIVVEASTG